MFLCSDCADYADNSEYEKVLYFKTCQNCGKYAICISVPYEVVHDEKMTILYGERE